jgi:HAD superfamily hydrolase (TIGR01509 family)
VIQTIVFDFGNVVGFFDHYRALEQIAPHTDLSTREMYACVYDTDLEDRLESGTMTVAEFLAEVHRLWQLRCDHSCLSQLFADIFTPNPEVCALIPRLARRYQLILGSNTNEVHSTHFRRQFAEVLGHFDALVLSHEVGVRKPKEGFFRACERKARGGPASCLFIDDLPGNVAGATALGWHGIVYRAADDLPGKLAALGVQVPE